MRANSHKRSSRKQPRNDTERILMAVMTNGIGMPHQLATKLGIPWPLPSGWKQDFIERDALKGKLPMGAFAAKYMGTCTVCDQPWFKGDILKFVSPPVTGGKATYAHVECTNRLA